ncbi:hypothetical protein [Parerythrobacter lacustris]|uniref:HK97 gp10 family phage protein n=1 Tax=Parerythrobacter lacustris TaxID=2969984 RepID=A0ABT1XP89_9SPHN|nr:hypothetical protein [Parerythrobacter lacustris]MCR2833480.1 hypothetical protein [Parerythrobacter lacustris]
MINVSVQVQNLDTLRANFRRAPATTLKYLAAATKASIFEVEKQAVDRNFQFKTPRAMRTGYLALSFGYGRQFANGGLRGTIGPTAHYSPYVYFGARGGQPNPFMDRIAKKAEPEVNKHFETAVNKIVSELADV